MSKSYELSGQPRITRNLNQLLGPLRGVVSRVIPPGATNSHGTNQTGQTMVNIELYDDFPSLLSVPILRSKSNSANGEHWSPEKHDMVLVDFIDGQFLNPVCIGALPHPRNEVETLPAEYPRYHRVFHGTEETWGTDGDRRLSVAAGDSVTITGDGSVTVGGGLTISVTGDAVIDVSGVADITVGGAVKLTAPTVELAAATSVTLTTPLVAITGALTVGGTLVATGAVSSATSVADPTGTMAQQRSTYNSHTHEENGDGGGTTDAPTELM